jgi:hypothetical protein
MMKEAIEKIVGYAIKNQAPVEATVKGREGVFYDGRFHPKDQDEKIIVNEESGYEVKQIGQFVDAVKLFAETNEGMVVVAGVNTLKAYGARAENGERNELVTASLSVPAVLHVNARSERTIDISGEPQDVVLALYSAFERDAPLLNLLTALSKIKEVGECNVDDNGVSQNVTIQKSIVTAENAKIENPVMLKPKMCFTGVDMPEVAHIVRVDSATKVQVFSHDLDWQAKITDNTKAFLTEALCGEGSTVTVI